MAFAIATRDQAAPNVDRRYALFAWLGAGLLYGSIVALMRIDQRAAVPLTLGRALALTLPLWPFAFWVSWAAPTRWELVGAS